MCCVLHAACLREFICMYGRSQIPLKRNSLPYIQAIPSDSRRDVRAPRTPHRHRPPPACSPRGIQATPPHAEYTKPLESHAASVLASSYVAHAAHRCRSRDHEGSRRVVQGGPPAPPSSLIPAIHTRDAAAGALETRVRDSPCAPTRADDAPRVRIPPPPTPSPPLPFRKRECAGRATARPPRPNPQRASALQMPRPRRRPRAPEPAASARDLDACHLAPRDLTWNRASTGGTWPLHTHHTYTHTHTSCMLSLAALARCDRPTCVRGRGLAGAGGTFASVHRIAEALELFEENRRTPARHVASEVGANACVDLKDAQTAVGAHLACHNARHRAHAGRRAAEGDGRAGGREASIDNLRGMSG